MCATGQREKRCFVLKVEQELAKKENNGQKEEGPKSKNRVQRAKTSDAEDGIRTRASEEIGALNRRLRPTRPPPQWKYGSLLVYMYIWIFMAQVLASVASSPAAGCTVVWWRRPRSTGAVQRQRGLEHSSTFERGVVRGTKQRCFRILGAWKGDSHRVSKDGQLT